MKKLIPFLVVALFLFGAGSASADGEYTRVIIPRIGLSVVIQPLKQFPDGGWPEPNHVGAWCLVPDNYPGQKNCLQAIYSHRDGAGSGFDLLERGDLVYLDVGGFEQGPRQLRLQLRVTEVKPVLKEAEDSLLGVVGGDVFILITCHPEGDPEAPERLIVWMERDYGPQWAYIDWGDTLSEIAQRYGTTVGAIVETNGIENPNLIIAGKLLLIPETTN